MTSSMVSYLRVFTRGEKAGVVKSCFELVTPEAKHDLQTAEAEQTEVNRNNEWFTVRDLSII